MTKIDIISGFLGAGKTTLIRKLLSEALGGEKVVLIENEFGEIGIDGGFLKDAGVQVTEMNSGCICCSLVGDFGEALRKVITQYAPDRILIEPSGVGKLSDVIRAVEGVAQDLGVRLNSFVTVADASKTRLYLRNFGEFYNNQVESACAILLTRTADMPQDKLDAAVALLREHNAKARIVTTPWAELSGAKLLEAMEQSHSLADEMLAELAAHPHAEHAHHHGHDEHEHDENCDCGCHEHEHDEHAHEHAHHHDHDENCDCGCHEHDHAHHHGHDENCDCGCHEHEHEHAHDHDHEHHHEHDHDENCDCGCHEHEHEHAHDHAHHHEHDHDEHAHDHDHDEHEHHHDHAHHHGHDENCDCGCHEHEHAHHHHDHDENCTCGCHDADEVFTSWGVETPHKYGRAELAGILEQLDAAACGMVLRAKGIVPCTEGGWLNFDYVPGEASVRDGAADYTGRLCVIGSNLDETRIKSLFRIV